MSKVKTFYICKQCGFETSKWLGKCPECESWNSFIEEKKQTSFNNSNLLFSEERLPKNINELELSQCKRIDTKINELNRVLGGGLTEGSLVLISGEPGVGKSTLLLQTAVNISNCYGNVLYISGEESESQIKMRADRLNIKSSSLYVLSETKINDIEVILEKTSSKFVIIDSIQTIYSENIPSAPGSVSQIRECVNLIMKIAKIKKISFFIVAHITKQGDLAGPKALEHMVDTVLNFEGDRTEQLRFLRTVKNRFGNTSEIGVFEMDEEGLLEVSNPSKLFIGDLDVNIEGTSMIGILEGSRVFIAELQALVSESKLPFPKRTSIGINISRLQLIIAVLEKKCKIPFYNYDIYVNIVGGLNIFGTYSDLGLAVALISSFKNKPINLNKTIAIGEIGLTGEIRPISSCDKIVNEGIKMGYKNFLIPKRNLEKLKIKDQVNIIPISFIYDLVKIIF